MILEHAIFLGLPRVVLGFQNFGRFCPRALVIAHIFFWQSCHYGLSDMAVDLSVFQLIFDRWVKPQLIFLCPVTKCISRILLC